MKPQIDKMYVYKPSSKIMEGRFNKLNTMHYKDRGYQYLRGNVIEQSQSIYRYAKTITIDGQDRTLLVVTEHGDKKAVSQFFVETIKKIKADNDKLSVFVKADSKPLDMGEWYVY